MLGLQFKRATLVLVLTTMLACQSPVLIFSGGALEGPASETDSFAFAGQFALLQLEVRPGDAYSIILRVLMRDDQLYIDAAKRRRWHRYLQENNQVRVKLGESVYPATAVLVDDPEITKLFLQDRTIYRLVPRSLRRRAL